MSWIEILVSLGRVLGPLAIDLVQSALEGADPLARLAREHVAEILPTLQSETALEERLHSLEHVDLAARAAAASLALEHGAQAPAVLAALRAWAKG